MLEGRDESANVQGEAAGFAGMNAAPIFVRFFLRRICVSMNTSVMRTCGTPGLQGMSSGM